MLSREQTRTIAKETRYSNRYGKYLGATYPTIVLQFMRQGENFDFELVTWWQQSSEPTDYEIKVEICQPSVKQLERIHAEGSCIMLDKFTKK